MVLIPSPFSPSERRDAGGVEILRGGSRNDPQPFRRLTCFLFRVRDRDGEKEADVRRGGGCRRGKREYL